MKRFIIWTLLTLSIGSVFGIKVWQGTNKWFDINFNSESEYGNTFLYEKHSSNQIMTNNNLALDVNHLNFRMGICDYRTKHFIQSPSSEDSVGVYQTHEREAIYSDIAIYMEPRLRLIFSLYMASLDQPAPYYNKLSTPVGRITILKQVPWYNSFVTLEAAYSTNLQTNKSIKSSKSDMPKYVGFTNQYAENALIFDIPDVYDRADEHYKVGFAYISNAKRGFNPLPDRMPMIYTPNNTFKLKTTYDYYDTKEDDGDRISIKKIGADTSFRFWRFFELAGSAKAEDYYIDNSPTDVSSYDLSANIKGYLYDFAEAKLIPTIGYRHIENYDNFGKELTRLDKALTLSAYMSLMLNKNVLLSGVITEDSMISWYRNPAYPEHNRLNFDKHGHIISVALGMTVWY